MAALGHVAVARTTSVAFSRRTTESAESTAERGGCRTWRFREGGDTALRCPTAACVRVRVRVRVCVRACIRCLHRVVPHRTAHDTHRPTLTPTQTHTHTHLSCAALALTPTTNARRLHIHTIVEQWPVMATRIHRYNSRPPRSDQECASVEAWFLRPRSRALDERG